VNFELILPFLRPIETLLLDDSISEIMGNPDASWWYEREGILRSEPSISFDAGKRRADLEFISYQFRKDLAAHILPIRHRVFIGDYGQLFGAIYALWSGQSAHLVRRGLVRPKCRSVLYCIEAKRAQGFGLVCGPHQQPASIHRATCYSGLILCCSPALLRHRSGPNPAPGGTCRSASPYHPSGPGTGRTGDPDCGALRVWVSSNKFPALKYARRMAQRAGEISCRTHPRKHVCGTWEPGPFALGCPE
jgi:hypothetical protein